MAAFLYCSGYFFKISEMRFLLSSVNSKGMLALFSAVSRCCVNNGDDLYI